MGTDSNRSRTRCKHEFCNNKATIRGLTRSESGLCVDCRPLPAELMVIREGVRDPIAAVKFGAGKSGSWPVRGPLTWDHGVVERKRLAQTDTLQNAPEPPQTVQTPIPAPIAVAPATEAADAPNSDSRALWSLAIFVACGAGVAFLLSPMGQQFLKACGGDK